MPWLWIRCGVCRLQSDFVCWLVFFKCGDTSPVAVGRSACIVLSSLLVPLPSCMALWILSVLICLCDLSLLVSISPLDVGSNRLGRVCAPCDSTALLCSQSLVHGDGFLNWQWPIFTLGWGDASCKHQVRMLGGGATQATSVGSENHRGDASYKRRVGKSSRRRKLRSSGDASYERQVGKSSRRRKLRASGRKIIEATQAKIVGRRKP